MGHFNILALTDLDDVSSMDEIPEVDNDLPAGEFEKMAAAGPVEEQVEKTRSYMLKTFEENKKKNGAWMRWLQAYYIDGENNYDGYEELVKSITAEDIRQLAKFIIEQGNFIEVSMVPAE